MMELVQYTFLAVLPLAVAVLWKRRLTWFGAVSRRRRLEVLDRVNLTHQHSVHLLRVEDRWIALAVTPKGLDSLASGPLATGQPFTCGDPTPESGFGDELRKAASR